MFFYYIFYKKHIKSILYNIYFKVFILNTFYICDICETKYRFLGQAQDCEASHNHQTFNVGDVVKLKNKTIFDKDNQKRVTDVLVCITHVIGDKQNIKYHYKFWNDKEIIYNVGNFTFESNDKDIELFISAQQIKETQVKIDDIKQLIYNTITRYTDVSIDCCETNITNNQQVNISLDLNIK